MRFKVKISRSSIHKWIKEFSDICTYWNLRPEIMKKYNIRNKADILESFSFKHSGLTYNFMYHKPKLGILCHRFDCLGKYLIDMKKMCPSDFFKEDERCSKLQINVKIKKEDF